MSNEKKKYDNILIAVFAIIGGIGFVLYQAYLWVEKNFAVIIFFVVVALVLYFLFKVFLSTEAVEKRAYRKQQALQAKEKAEYEKKVLILAQKNREEENHYHQLRLVSNKKQEEVKIRIESVKNNLLSPVIKENKNLMDSIENERQKLYKNLNEIHYLMTALQNKKKDLLNMSEKEKFLWKN